MPTDPLPERRVTGWAAVALALLAAMIAWTVATGGAGAQEPFELFFEPEAYGAGLAAAAPALRVTLALDLGFIIAYGLALGLAAWIHRGRAPFAAGVALGAVGLTVALDLAENLLLLVHLEQALLGLAISPAGIGAQVIVSGGKWFAAAIVLVALAEALPRARPAERLLVWLGRLGMPLGAGLMVTQAWGLGTFGGAIVFVTMVGGLGLLALTAWQRART